MHRHLAATLVALVAALTLVLAVPAEATTEDPLRDLPTRVDTSPDRMRFVRMGAVVGAVALIAIAGAVLTGRDDD